ncbi:hypothetical protein CBR_g72646 [Chara braunii]|uniref:ATP synthase 24 kDa subunit, mitochondrial n=1 Tax=Chara braunii TaxID=69332 RepID=A0A388KA47_CHABU|nr:hypothetical protein CBR_g72646 [Chara braunii]|eukprot:GBG66891.1 hypothetical protein CBR_g72646 [Chara braunii]
MAKLYRALQRLHGSARGALGQVRPLIRDASGLLGNGTAGGSHVRAFAVAAAEDDVIKTAFSKQQQNFRATLKELEKVQLPMDPEDPSQVEKYASIMKSVRQKLGVPSMPEKIGSLIDEAYEAAPDVRSFLEESKRIRQELGIEDYLGVSSLTMEALDRLEQKSGKRISLSDTKEMAAFRQEIQAINQKLGLTDSLEQLEQEVEMDMAKEEMTEMKNAALEKMESVKKKDGLDFINVDLKTLNPSAYL